MNTKNKFKQLTEKQKKILSIIFFLIFLIFCGIVMWFIGRPMIEFVSEPEKFRAWVDEKGILGKIAFIGMMVLQVTVALIPGEPLELGAGYAFGAIEGTLLCVLGITLGSLAVFALVRTWGVKFVEVFFSRNKINELKILKNSRKRNLLIFIIFFLPGTPKDLLTYFVGLTDIKFERYILIASLARLPSILTSTFSGSALGVEEYKTAIIILGITLIVSVSGWVIYKFLIKGKKDNH